MIEVDISNGFDLGCYHFEVVTGDKTNRELSARDRFGECSTMTRAIRVCTDWGQDHTHCTFMHEIIEAVNTHSCNGKIKHDEITTLANGMAQVFKSMGIIFGVSKVKE